MSINPALRVGVLALRGARGLRNTWALRVGVLITAALAASAQNFHATIATEDGSPLPTSPQIIPDLSERLVQECQILNIFGNGSVQYLVNPRSRPYDPATADACSVTIRLKGYRPAQVTLRNDATIVLKRAGLHEGSTVSATALNAPEPAKKAYGKGVNAMNDEKWAAAQKNLEKAVEIDPDYAQAWSDLGEVLQKQSKAKEARAAWEKAIAADPKYIKPYIQLTMLDLAEKRPEDAITIGGKAVAMNPLEFPQLYFFYAVANFNLKHLDVAETNARRATELDSAHEVPQAELLLGSVLAAKSDRAGALKHFRKYLEILPKAKDADQVKRAIAQLEAPGDAK
jgi:tetratricopeptide (TPR) repeat protein